MPLKFKFLALKLSELILNNFKIQSVFNNKIYELFLKWSNIVKDIKKNISELSNDINSDIDNIEDNEDSDNYSYTYDSSEDDSSEEEHKEMSIFSEDEHKEMSILSEDEQEEPKIKYEALCDEIGILESYHEEIAIQNSIAIIDGYNKSVEFMNTFLPDISEIPDNDLKNFKDGYYLIYQKREYLRKLNDGENVRYEKKSILLM